MPVDKSLLQIMVALLLLSTALRQADVADYEDIDIMAANLPDTQEDAQCRSDTGGTCRWSGCDSSRKATCKNSKCVCSAG